MLPTVTVGDKKDTRHVFGADQRASEKPKVFDLHLMVAGFGIVMIRDDV